MTTIMSPSIQGSGCLYMSINQPLNLSFPSSYLLCKRGLPGKSRVSEFCPTIIMFKFLIAGNYTLAIVRNQSPLQKVFSPVITLNFIEFKLPTHAPMYQDECVDCIRSLVNAERVPNRIWWLCYYNGCCLLNESVRDLVDTTSTYSPVEYELHCDLRTHWSRARHPGGLARSSNAISRLYFMC